MFASMAKKATVKSSNEAESSKAKISPKEKINDIIDFDYVPAENEYSIRNLQRALKVVFHKIEASNIEAETELIKKVSVKKACGYSNCSLQCYNNIGRLGIHFYNPVHKIVTFQINESGELYVRDDASVLAAELLEAYKDEIKKVIETRDYNNAVYFDAFRFETLEVINFKGGSAFLSPIKPNYLFVIEEGRRNIQVAFSLSILNDAKHISSNSLSWQKFFEANDNILLDNCFINAENFPQMLKDELKDPSKLIIKERSGEQKKSKDKFAIA